MDYALEKLHVHSVEKRRRMIKRSSNISETDSEAIIKRLMSDLHERGVAKKTRSVEVSRVKLEGASQSMAAKQGNSSFASSSIGKVRPPASPSSLALQPRPAPRAPRPARPAPGAPPAGVARRRAPYHQSWEHVRASLENHVCPAAFPSHPPRSEPRQ